MVRGDEEFAKGFKSHRFSHVRGGEALEQCEVDRGLVRSLFLVHF